jgi:hypothetical protein
MSDGVHRQHLARPEAALLDDVGVIHVDHANLGSGHDQAVTVEAQRPLQSDDEPRVRAERARETGDRHRRAERAEAYAHAIAVFGEALSITRLLADLLFGVSPTDPATFAAVAVLVAGVAAAASWLPARRATRIDPATTIREA